MKNHINPENKFDWITEAEVAILLKIHPVTVRRNWEKWGLTRSQISKKNIYYRNSEILSLMEKNAKKGGRYGK